MGERVERTISDWNGASGGSRDNPAELLAKCKANFRSIFRKLHHPDYVAFFDDFEGPTLTTKLAVVAGSDSPAGGAITVAKGGKYRLTTGDSGASQAADAVQLSGSLNWYAENDDLVFEAKVNISAITAVQMFVGLTDQVASLEMPFSLSGTSYTSNASDAVGFLFDTGATTDTIRLVGVANDVDATHQDTSNAWEAAVETVFRIEVTTAGVATFYINGVQVGTAMTAAVRASIGLAPVITVRSLTTNSKTLDIDYIMVSMKRV